MSLTPAERRRYADQIGKISCSDCARNIDRILMVDGWPVFFTHCAPEGAPYAYCLGFDSKRLRPRDKRVPRRMADASDDALRDWLRPMMIKSGSSPEWQEDIRILRET